MANMTTPKKDNAVVAERGRALTPAPDFPFFLSYLRDEMDRLFGRFAHVWDGNGHGWKWGLDIQDLDDNIVVRAEAPGFEPNDFDLQVRGNELVLKATRKVETKDKNGKVQEAREQEFSQSVVLPVGIDKEKVNAKYQNGILTVTLPRTAESKGKRIPVLAG